MNLHEESPQEMYTMLKIINLAEDGAQSVHVYVEEDSLLMIGDVGFNKPEAVKIRDFINEWITHGD